MKQFVLGSAFLMFISSLPADSTNDHAISVAAPKLEVQKVAFLPSFGDTPTPSSPPPPAQDPWIRWRAS